MPLRRLIITLLVIGPILALLAWGFTRDAKYIVIGASSGCPRCRCGEGVNRCRGDAAE